TGVRKSDIARTARLVLINRNKVRHTTALRVGTTNGVARGFGGNHDDVDVIARNHLAVVHVKAVSKCQCGTGLDVASNLSVVDLGDVLVGQQNHDDVGLLHGIGHFSNLKAGVDSLVPGGAPLAQTDHHLDARIVQVERVRVALRAVTDDGDSFALDERQVAVLVIKHFHV